MAEHSSPGYNTMLKLYRVSNHVSMLLARAAGFCYTFGEQARRATVISNFQEMYPPKNFAVCIKEHFSRKSR